MLVARGDEGRKREGSEPRGRLQHLGLAIVGGLVATALAPTGALAGTVSESGSTLTYTAGRGEANAVSVVPAGSNIELRDPGAQAIDDADGAGGCTVSGGIATCPGAGVSTVVVRTRDLADRAVITTPTADVVEGNDGDDLLRTGVGNDTLRGQQGADTLEAGDGNDTLDGGTQADSFSGGAARDLVDYGARTEALWISIDNVANDGSALDGGADDVRTNVERVLAGSGHDQLVGNDQDSELTGGAGGDILRGLGGRDVLMGGESDDTLVGGTGPDDLWGNGGRDLADYSTRTAAIDVTLDIPGGDGERRERDNIHSDVENVATGAGDDFLQGDGGSNTLYGGGGRDTFHARGGGDDLYGDHYGVAGSDFVNGGDGNDTLHSDEGDDQLWGENGDDVFPDASTGPNGADYINGGPDWDVVSYANRQGGVTVTLDTQRNDGAPSEGDFVNASVDEIQGGLGSDTLVGSVNANVIVGGAGDAPDTIHGYTGDDRLFGRGGGDDVTGGGGADEIYGEADDDVLWAKDGEVDTVSGGDGIDRAEFDASCFLFICSDVDRVSGVEDKHW